MTDAENYMRAVEFRGPDRIPYNVFIMPATRRKYGKSLEDLISGYPEIAKSYQVGSREYYSLPEGYKKGTYVDEWGCEWGNLHTGMIGQVTRFPLADWDKFSAYEPPDPYAGVDWQETEKSFRLAKEAGRLARGHGGSMFHRLTFLRGFQNLMLDIAEGSDALHEMIRIVQDYEVRRTARYLDIGAQIMSYGDDLGIQTGLPMSPEHFRRYFGPSFAKIFGMCRQADAHVYLHTDGNILEIMDDLIEYGVTILNPEDYPNGLENIAKTCKGKVCVDLTFAQQFFPSYSPVDIFSYFARVVKTLGSKDGGLIWYVEIDPDVPFENIEAIFSAVREYHTHI